MRRAAMALALLGMTAACGGGSTKTAAPVATTTPPPVATTVFPDGATKTVNCRSYGALPDHGCTPGSLNPAVTQDSIATTICTTGWTATVRPTSAVTDQLKTQVATAYAITDGLTAYQGDHLIPLELGGALADVANFWDQPNQLSLPDGTIVAAGQKDALENALKAGVCAGRLTLLDAQHQIAADWYGAWTAAGKPGAAPATTIAPATTAAPVTSPPVTAPAATTPATTRAITATTAGPASASYANCAAVRAAGKAPLHRGDPGYSSSLDRDGDGIACE